MKILQICSARLIGGGERYLANLSNSLARRGHRIFLALAPNSPLEKELREINPENILHSKMRNALDVFSAFEIADFVRRNDIEIIHAHLARDYPLAAAASRLAKKPFVLTRHVLFPLNPLQKIALKRVSGVIAPSDAVADALQKQNIFPREKISLVRYGIDTAHFSPRKKIPGEIIKVGTIGHLAPIKGHDTFIEAAAIVLRKHADVQFVIVGEDKSRTGENRREIENLIERLNLQPKIEMAGWTDDVRLFLEDFDIFVSAAREEAFGLVMVEAMMHKLPVVATRSEGATEIIVDGISGVLISIGNTAEMAQAISDLIENPARREQLGKKAQERVVEHFSLERMVGKTEEFYRNVIKNSL